VLLRIGACWFALLSVACGSRLPPPVPSNTIVGADSALPTPKVESNDAPPKMLGMRFSSLDVRRGEHWSGRFVTSTNVASVEVRTSLFSINVPHVGPGRFQFTLDVLDTPPIFVRSYRLRVIARNSAGDGDEEDLPFRIR
jgi:hypothetical protein